MKHGLNKCHVSCVLWVLVSSKTVGSVIRPSWVQFLTPSLSICASSLPWSPLWHDRRDSNQTYLIRLIVRL